MCSSNTVTSQSPQISKLKEKINIDLLLFFLVGRCGIYLRSSSSNIDFSIRMTSLEKIVPVVQALNKWQCDIVQRLKHNACDSFADFVIRSEFYWQHLNHLLYLHQNMPNATSQHVLVRSVSNINKNS